MNFKRWINSLEVLLNKMENHSCSTTLQDWEILLPPQLVPLNFQQFVSERKKHNSCMEKALVRLKTLLRTLCWYNSPLVGVQHLPCHKWWNFLQSKRCQAQNTLEHVYIHSTWAGPNGTWFAELHNLTQLPKYNCSNPVK